MEEFWRDISSLVAAATVKKLTDEGDRVLDLTPDRTDFSLYEADVPLGIISQDFLVRYRTSRTSLTSA